MDYTKLTLPELANGISQTERAIRRCKDILDDLLQPKTMGLQAVVEATRALLPTLEEDLKRVVFGQDAAMVEHQIGRGLRIRGKGQVYRVVERRLVDLGGPIPLRRRVTLARPCRA